MMLAPREEARSLVEDERIELFGNLQCSSGIYSYKNKGYRSSRALRDRNFSMEAGLSNGHPSVFLVLTSSSLPLVIRAMKGINFLGRRENAYVLRSAPEIVEQLRMSLSA